MPGRFGAVDPNSGTTAMLEAARGVWHFVEEWLEATRGIVLCSWDGEEYGSVGFDRVGRRNADELKQKAVAYLNMDAAVSGANFGASSVPSMWKLIRAATRDVSDPKSGKTIYQQWQDRARVQRPEAEMTDAETGSDSEIAEARIGALGSGSDYTPFLQHLGIPSIDMGFGGDYGVYHSAYDSFLLDEPLWRSDLRVSRDGGAIVGDGGDASCRRSPCRLITRTMLLRSVITSMRV